MTIIAVESSSFQSEKKSWLNPQPGGIGQGYARSGTLDISQFTPGTHYPNGYIPSGILLGRVTATKRLVPYDNAASDGRETAVGFLFFSTPAKQGGANPGVAYVAAFAVIRTSKLPFTTGVGSLDAAGRADLPTLYFED